MTTIRRLWPGLLLSAASCFCAASPPPLTEIAPPATGIGATGEQFGSAIAVDGDRRAVGAINRVRVDPDVSDGVRAGAVLIYADSTTPPKLLQLPNGSEGDLFGAALALCGEWLLVGAPLVDAGGEDAGAVYAFREIGGVYGLQGRIDGDADGQRLGGALACAGARAAAGGRGRALSIDLQAGVPILADVRPTLTSHGAAVAVDADSLWVLAPGPAGSSLSRHVAIGGTLTGSLPLPGSDAASLLRTAEGVLAGLPGADGGRGQVLRVRGDSGLSLAGSLPAPGSTAERFGQALALNAEATRLLIGAPAASGFEGAAYWYRATGDDWTAGGRLDAVDGGEVELLGESVALAGTEAWVGAPLQVITDGLSQGAVFRWRLPATGQAEPLPILDLGRSAARSRFGQAIAADGGQLLVGAFLADTGQGADAGLAWVYPPGGGEPARLSASDGRPDSRYGIAVALDGARALVGAYFDAVDGQIDRGSAYLHERVNGQWIQRQKLIAGNGNIREYFGLAVALEGSVAVVAAPGAIVEQAGAGRVHVYRRDVVGNWNEEQVLEPPAPIFSGNYGRGLALAGGRLYVGEPFAAVGALTEAGAVHVYRDVQGSFVFERTLTEPVPQAGAVFGFGLAAVADAALIGAPQANGTGRAWWWQPGAASVLRALTPPDLQSGELYGLAVELSDTAALVSGSGHDRGNAQDVGRAHYWRRANDDWLRREVWAAPREFPEQFGRSLALDGDTVFLGAPNAARLSPQEGAVYRADAAELLGASGFERAPTVPLPPP